MALDPALQRLIRRAYAAGHGRLSQMTPEEARQHCAKLVPLSHHALPFEDFCPQHNICFRIHRHRGQARATVLYLRGSAFTGGGLLDETNQYCHDLAHLVQCDVINIGFRVAPVHRFPIYFEDCVATFDWILAHQQQLGLHHRFILWGESSGGTKAAALSQYYAQNLPFSQLVLAYPMLDLVSQTASKQAFGQGYLLDLSMIEWLKDKTLNHPLEAYDYRVSPGLNTITANLPTLIITAEYDPLRDEGEAYAQRLRQQGVPVKLLRKDSMVHGFLRYYQRLNGAKEAFEWLQENLIDYDSNF